MTKEQNEKFYKILLEFRNFQETLEKYQDSLADPFSADDYHKDCMRYEAMYENLWGFYHEMRDEGERQ